MAYSAPVQSPTPNRPGSAATSRRRGRYLLLAAAAVLALMAGLLASTSSPAHAAAALLSQGQPTTASSQESAATPASDATDGNTTTRWSSAFSDPQWLQVDLGSVSTISQVVLNWENAYATAFQIQVSTDGSTWTPIYSTTTGTGGTQTLNVSGSGRYVRMYGTARATGYGYSLWEFQVYGTSGGTTGSSCGTTNAAQDRPATASSAESAAYPASAAVDGDITTRWSSAFSDPQWLEVDLGSAQPVCQVTLDWEAAYATAFQIQFPPTAAPGPRSTRPPPAPAGSRPWPSPGPAGTCGCTAPPGPPATATACGSSAFSPVAVAPPEVAAATVPA